LTPTHRPRLLSCPDRHWSDSLTGRRERVPIGLPPPVCRGDLDKQILLRVSSTTRGYSHTTEPLQRPSRGGRCSTSSSCTPFYGLQRLTRSSFRCFASEPAWPVATRLVWKASLPSPEPVGAGGLGSAAFFRTRCATHAPFRATRTRKRLARSHPGPVDQPPHRWVRNLWLPVARSKSGRLSSRRSRGSSTYPQERVFKSFP